MPVGTAQVSIRSEAQQGEWESCHKNFNLILLKFTL